MLSHNRLKMLVQFLNVFGRPGSYEFIQFLKICNQEKLQTKELNSNLF